MIDSSFSFVGVMKIHNVETYFIVLYSQKMINVNISSHLRRYCEEIQ